ncbi:MAG: lysophospholipid acyltransferase family protein [Pseudomonadota bacterium]
MARSKRAVWNPLTELLRHIVQGLIWVIGQVIYRYWFSLSYRGRENLPQAKPYLLAANHTSHLDGPAIIAALGKHPANVCSLAAKDYFFNHPVKGWLCKTFLNMIPLERGEQAFTFKYLSECHRISSRKKIILIFPEGTRSLSGELQSFKPGLGLLASRLNVPIVPVYVHGTYYALPKGRRFPGRHPVYVAFGTPLDTAAYQARYESAHKRRLYREIADDVHAAVARLRDQRMTH